MSGIGPDKARCFPLAQATGEVAFKAEGAEEALHAASTRSNISAKAESRCAKTFARRMPCIMVLWSRPPSR